MMVEALTLENYVKFFTDPYYTGVSGRPAGRLRATAICLLLGFPLAYVLARTQTRYKNVLIMLVVLPLFVGNAVRAAGWMTLFGSKGFLNARLMGLGAITQPLADHVHRDGGDHRHHRGEPALHGADAAERDRGHRPLGRGGGLQPRRRALTMFRRVLLPLALPGILAGTILTFILGDERLCHAGAARRAALQDDGAAGLRPVSS